MTYNFKLLSDVFVYIKTRYNLYVFFLFELNWKLINFLIKISILFFYVEKLVRLNLILNCKSVFFFF